ncbi:MAG: hypothetical protein WDO71_25970 [Bacteroidota bacterium]
MDGKRFSLAKPDFIKALQINDSSVYSLYCLSSLYNFDNINDSALILINKAMSVKYKDGYARDYNNYFSQRFDIKYNELIFFRGIIYYDLRLLDYARNDFIHLVADNYEVGEGCAYLSAIYQKKNVIDSACYYQYEAQRYGYRDVVDSVPALSCITSAKN